MSTAYPQKVSSEQPFFGGGSISGAGVQIAPTSSPPRAVLIDIVRAVAVCAAPAANREQTQIASALTTILVFELSVSEMQPNNDENLPKLGSTTVGCSKNLHIRGFGLYERKTGAVGWFNIPVYCSAALGLGGY